VCISFHDEVIRPGYEKVVRGEGMPIVEQRGARGDLKVKFEIVFPKELTDEQRAGIADILKGCC
jgi:DnaJ homolog subfamily B member 13